MKIAIQGQDAHSYHPIVIIITIMALPFHFAPFFLPPPPPQIPHAPLPTPPQTPEDDFISVASSRGSPTPSLTHSGSSEYSSTEVEEIENIVTEGIAPKNSIQAGVFTAVVSHLVPLVHNIQMEDSWDSSQDAPSDWRMAGEEQVQTTEDRQACKSEIKIEESWIKEANEDAQVNNAMPLVRQLMPEPKCWNCKKTGHVKKDCPYERIRGGWKQGKELREKSKPYKDEYRRVWKEEKNKDIEELNKKGKTAYMELKMEEIKRLEDELKHCQEQVRYYAVRTQVLRRQKRGLEEDPHNMEVYVNPESLEPAIWVFNTNGTAV